MFLVVAAAWAQAPQLEPLLMPLPKPLFEGTPPNLKGVPNLERPSGKPRPAFLAPPGAVNVARGKPVSSCVSDPTIGELELITEGNNAGADGTYVELGSGVQSVTIDVKQNCTLSAIVVWHYHKQPRVYSDVVAQVADDRTSLPTCARCSITITTMPLAWESAKISKYIETHEGKLIE